MSLEKKIDVAEKGINLFDGIVSKIKNAFCWFQYNFYKVDLKKLTNIEKQIINKFYDDNLNEYTLGHVSIRETDDNYASVLKLIHRKILENQTTIEKIENYDGYGVKYKLTKRAWKKLNKQHQKHQAL